MTREPRAARVRLWVTMTIVLPAATSFRKSWKTSSAVVESRLPVGSSATSSGGSLDRARAMAARCCWPPETWLGSLWAVSYTHLDVYKRQELVGQEMPISKAELDDLLDFTPRCAYDPARVFPLLGETDVFFKLEKHAGQFATEPVVVPRAHVFSLYGVRPLREHILRVMAWACLLYTSRCV